LADFLIKMNLDPADLPYRPNGDPATETEKYLVAHLYETHDLWHVTTGFETDVAGEAGLQAFYLAQMGLPLAGVLLAAILLNSAFFARDDFKRRMNAIATGWKMGRQSKALFGLPWRALMDRPLAEVRRSLGIVQDESCTWIAADYQIA
jgi:ubiquinone biosynthesis protein Coq4